MKLKLAVALLASSLWCGWAQAQDNWAYNFVTTGTRSPGISFANSSLTAFAISWDVSPPVLSCALQVDSSADGVSWGSGDLIATQNCAAVGSVAATSLAAGKNFVRINVTGLNGNGGVNVRLRGYAGAGGSSSSSSLSGQLTGQIAQKQGASLAATNASPFFAFPGLTAFGTSLTNGFGDSTPSKSYAQLVANDVGGAYQNLALNGDMVADGYKKFILPFSNPQNTRNAPFFLEYGVQEGNVAGLKAYTTADQQSNYSSMMTGAAAWLAIPQTNKVFGQACTKTSGSWTNDTTTFAPVTTYAVQSTTNASVLTCSITTVGPTLYLAYRALDGDGGTATVSVDGGATDVISGFGKNGSLISTFNGGTDSVFTYTKAVAAGAHTVVVTVTSATNAANIISIVWLGSAPTAVSTTTIAPPVVYLMGVIKQQNDGNSALRATLDGLNKTVATTLLADGLNVQYVNAAAYINPTGSAEMTDSLHPNDLGNQHWRDAVEFVMQPFNLTHGRGQTISAGLFESAYDNFNRANGAVGANWITITGENALNVASNVVIGSTVSANNGGYWTGPVPGTVFSDDQFSQATLTATNGAFGAGPVIRVQAASETYYKYVISSGARVVQRVINGASTTICTGGTGSVVGDVARIEVSDSNPQTVSAYYNGALDCSASDNQLTQGFPGLSVFNNVQSWDNWSGGNIHPGAQLDVESDWTQPIHPVFVQPNIGPLLVAANVVLNASWGTTATVTTLSGNAQRFTFTASSSGTGQAANPTMAITYPKAWPNTPFYVCKNVAGGTGVPFHVTGENGATTTTMTLTAQFTPTAGQTYAFTCLGL